jgi:glycosyltransferase involved in cell wall biosynthesis
VTKPRVVLLRGHGVTPWELRPWELLAERYDVTCLVTGRNRFTGDEVSLRTRRVRSRRDWLPPGRLGDLAVLVPGDRYISLAGQLAGADIVHSLELGNPWSGQPAELKRDLGFKLVLHAWETIPLLSAYRYPRGRRYREAAIAATDLFLATSGKARDTLLLEGVDEARIELCEPGIDTQRFGAIERTPEAVVSIGRLVWEKGHQDVLRAVAALRRGIVSGVAPRVVVVGRGPDGDRLRLHADELGIGDLVSFRSAPYGEMPRLLASASTIVLASLTTPVWEEQFGMVLAEAMAAGVPIVAARSGAIPEVVHTAATLFTPGDWRELAAALAGPAAPRDAALVERYSTTAAADRLGAAYDRVLAR